MQSRFHVHDIDHDLCRGFRRAVVTLELIFAIPVLVIVLLATIQVALILAASKHVEFASRLGAKLAAEASRADLATLNMPGTLKDDVDEYLNTAGYTDSCTVILEHNASGVSNPLQSNPDPAACNCGPVGSLPMTVACPGNPDIIVESVRVTVCLPMDGNIPNCLATFGFDLTGCTIQQSTVWRVETNP